MTASVYIQRSDAFTTLDIGRSSKIAEIDIPAFKVHNALPTYLQAKRAIFEILRDSQFKNMAESGALRMQPGVTIADVVKEVKRAVFEQDAVSPNSRPVDPAS